MLKGALSCSCSGQLKLEQWKVEGLGFRFQGLLSGFVAAFEFDGGKFALESWRSPSVAGRLRQQTIFREIACCKKFLGLGPQTRIVIYCESIEAQI